MTFMSDHHTDGADATFINDPSNPNSEADLDIQYAEPWRTTGGMSSMNDPFLNSSTRR